MEALRRIKANTIEKRLLNSRGEPNFNINFYILNAKGEYAGVTHVPRRRAASSLPCAMRRARGSKPANRCCREARNRPARGRSRQLVGDVRGRLTRILTPGRLTVTLTVCG